MKPLLEHCGWTIHTASKPNGDAFEASAIASRGSRHDEDAGAHVYVFNRLGRFLSREAADAAATLWVKQWLDDNI
jgi:hypothetical protein